jgi:hemerythrin-like domain-containing protein
MHLVADNGLQNQPSGVRWESAPHHRHGESIVMEATDILSSEHRVIERVIAALQAATSRLEAGQAVRPGFFLDAARFIRCYADGFHHRKEEGVLFQTMADNGMPTGDGPIAVMLHEHDRARDLTAGLREAAERLSTGDGSATRDVVSNARGYAELLTQHIYKEDNILFRMASSVIPATQHGTVLEAFARVEREQTGNGSKESFVALAQTLEDEATGG